MFTIQQNGCHWIGLRKKETTYFLENPKKFSNRVVFKRSGGNTSESFLFLVWEGDSFSPTFLALFLWLGLVSVHFILCC